MDHRSPGRRPVRESADRLAAAVSALRDRRCGAPLPPRVPPVAFGLVGRRGRASPGARRPPHRAEPDRDARHLPHHVHHRRHVVPGAGPASGWVPSTGRAVATDRLRCSARRIASGPGSLFGAAVATKWSGAFGLIFGAALCARRGRSRGDRRAGRSRPAHRRRRWSLRSCVVPLGVYLLSYGSFFFQHGPAIHDFITLQLRMLRYQQHHLRFQPENSRPWTWPLLLHPIQYFRACAANAVTHDRRARQPRAVVGVPRSCSRSGSSPSRGGRPGEMRSSSGATWRCTSHGSSCREASSSSTCFRPCRSCVSASSPILRGLPRRAAPTAADRVRRDHRDHRGAVPAGVDGLVDVRELAQPPAAPPALATVGRTKGAARRPPLLLAEASGVT